MGGRGGALWRRLTYRLPPPTHPHSHAASGATAGGQQGAPSSSSSPRAVGGGQVPGVVNGVHHPPPVRGTLVVEDAQGHAVQLTTSFFDHMEQLLGSYRLDVPSSLGDQLPFNFWGGLVGYLGYELKAECGAANAHMSPTPDAAMYFTDRLVVVDHQERDVYALGLYASKSAASRDAQSDTVSVSQEDAQGWVQRVVAQVEEMARKGHNAMGTRATNGSAAAASNLHTAGVNGTSSHQGSINGTTSTAHSGAHLDSSTAGAAAWQPPPFRLAHSKLKYKENVELCRRALYEGESYEVCLTTHLARIGCPNPATLYKTLRAVNPAPYAAWLHFGTGGPIVCCSSPERFLRADRGGVLEARPIKGTAPRRLGDARADAAAACALAASEKDRAENLMIVDLLRNDLGRVCEVGSVHVPGLMEIESYATVHQMVSTVRGLRRGGVSNVGCIRAAFPGGSMTGAPKVRTMEIIDSLEGCARGVYSGAVGFISLNDTFDLNIVIRTAIIDPQPPSAAATAPGANGSTAAVGNGVAGAKQSQGDVRGLVPDVGTVVPPGALPDALVRIGAGGAIVVQSEPEGEYDEMRLKARALMATFGKCDGSKMPAVVDEA